MQIKSTKSKSKTDHETTNYVNVCLCVGWQIRQDLKAIVQAANICVEISQHVLHWNLIVKAQRH